MQNRAAALGYLTATAIGLIAAFSLVLFLNAGVAHAAVPKIINYQGRLEDSAGNLLGGQSGADFDFKFSIYDSATGGTELWPSGTPATTTLAVTNGAFSVGLGDTALGFQALNLDFNSASPYYLQIQVWNSTSTSWETLSPRQPIDAVGFAINSASLDGHTNGTSSDDILQLDGNGNIDLPGGQIRTINSASCSGLTAIGGGALCYDTTSNGLFVYNSSSSSWETIGISASTPITWTALQTFNNGLTANATATFNNTLTVGTSTLISNPTAGTVSVGTTYAGFTFNVGGGAYVQNELNATTLEFRSGGDEITGLGSDGINFTSGTGGDLAHLTSQGLNVLATPSGSSSDSVLQLGPNALAPGSLVNASGTYIAINSTGTQDFINFQNNTTTKFEIDGNGNEYTTGYLNANAIGINYIDFQSAYGTRIGKRNSDGIDFQVGNFTDLAYFTPTGVNLVLPPPASSTSSLLQFGSNALVGGNSAGTYLGANSTSTADFINFQNNSSTVFQVANTSTANVDLYIGPNNLVTSNTNGTTIAENQSSGYLGDFINFEVNSSTVFGVTNDGTVVGVGGFSGQCLSSGSFSSSTDAACNMDAAESYPTYEQTQPGDIVVIPPAGNQTIDSQSGVVELGKSRGESGETVLGVVSTNPGLVFNNGNTLLAGKNDDLITASKTLVALVGRVPVNVSDENGPISAGDLLAPSPDEPGFAVRATAPGEVIGTALQSFDGGGSASSTGGNPQILIFINPHWSLGDLTISSDIATSGWAVPPSSGSAPILDQFTLYIKYGLQKLGLAISNGVASVNKLFANKVATNELCVGSQCINEEQFGELLSKNGIQSLPSDDTGGSAIPESSSSDAGASGSGASSSTATITVAISVNNSSGGAAKSSDFTVSMVAGNPSPSSFSGNASGTAITLDAGKPYYTNISTLAGYTASYDVGGDCNDKNGAAPGASVKCSITETYGAPDAAPSSDAASSSGNSSSTPGGQSGTIPPVASSAPTSTQPSGSAPSSTAPVSSSTTSAAPSSTSPTVITPPASTSTASSTPS